MSMNHILCITQLCIFYFAGAGDWWENHGQLWIWLTVLCTWHVLFWKDETVTVLVLHFETVTTRQLHCHGHYVYSGQLLTNTFWDTKSNLTSDCCCCMFLCLTSAWYTAEDGEACSAVSTAFPAKNSPSVCGSQAWPRSHFNKGHSVGLQSTLWVDTSWRDLQLL